MTSLQSILDGMGLDADTLALLSRPLYGQRDPVPDDQLPKPPAVERIDLTIFVGGQPGPMLNMPLLSERYLAERRALRTR